VLVAVALPGGQSFGVALATLAAFSVAGLLLAIAIPRKGQNSGAE
jgi:hypothetical protein